MLIIAMMHFEHTTRASRISIATRLLYPVVLFCCLAVHPPVLTAQLPTVDSATVWLAALKTATLPLQKAAIQLHLSEWWYDRGNLSKSVRYGQQSIASARKASNPLALAKALNQTARAEGRLGDLNRAIGMARQAASIFETLNEPMEYCYALNTAAAYLSTDGRAKEARDLLFRILQNEGELRAKRPALLGKVFSNIGYTYIIENDDISGEAYLSKALALASDVYVPSVVIYHNMSDVKARQGKYHESIKYELRALALAQIKRDTYSMAQFMVCIASFAIKANNPDKAMEYMEKTQTLLDGGLVAPRVSRSLLNTKAAYVAVYKKDIARAQRYQLEALRMPVAQTNDYKTSLYFDIAHNYLLLNNLDSAKYFANLAYPLVRSSPDKSRLCEYTMLETGIAIASGNSKQALEKLEEAVLMGEAAKLNRTREMASDLWDRLVVLDSTVVIKSPWLTKKMTVQIDSITDDFWQAAKLFEVNEATGELDIEIARQRIQLLESEQIVRQRLAWILGVSVIALLLLLIALFLRNRLLRTQKETLELEKETRRKTDELKAFNYTVSHDLKAPLKNAAGFVSLFQTQFKEQLDERAEDYLGQFNGQLSAMSLMIEGMRAYAEAEQTELLIRQIDTHALIQKIVAQLQPDSADRSIQYDIAQLPPLQGDPLMLRQVFTNLLSNAVKFTRLTTAPVIRVSGTVQHNYTCITVADNGVGISEEGQKRLFQLFKTAHDRTQYEGTGAGLVIAKRIVERHGGYITVVSEASKGAAFTVALPQCR